MKRDIPFTFIVTHPSARALARSPLVWTIALACAALLALFAGTTASIVEIWIRSETFAHGFLIVPLCIWLVFRKREALAQVPFRPWWPGVAFVFASGALWFLGEKAGAGVVEQFALAFMLQATIVSIIGLAAARVLVFPLAFLLFAVPFGEFCVPTLMDWTAAFTVQALRASGIPVYREANQFVIPSGAWSVVEGCSGIRYIIASVMIGTIYAATAYRSTLRRVLFVAAAFVVPIIANWLRAYLIVMLAHLSSMRLATGIDHIIYGWIFFGLVMLVLFWVGSFWQESSPPRAGAAFAWHVAPGPADPATARKQAAVACVALVAALLWRPVDFLVGRDVAKGEPALPPIAAAPGWAEVRSVESADAWTPRYAGAATTRRQSFAKDGRTVDVYVAYYRHQSEGHELITSTNVLTRPDDARWHVTTSRPGTVEWANGTAAVDRVEIGGRGGRIEALTFFWIDGAVTANAYEAKGRQAFVKLLGRGDDAALVVVSAPWLDHGDAAATLDAFTRAFASPIETALERARESGR